jgi:pimeloyl-ACP methyl ester carboxylesterase
VARRPAEPSPAPVGLFLGGWAVAADAYRNGLPHGWRCDEQPSFAETGGRFGAYVDWALGLLPADGAPVRLAGHSLGGAVAIAVAARLPSRIASVTVFGPAGLPTPGGLRRAARDVISSGLHLRLSTMTASRSALRTLDSPRAALRLAREVERLDLAAELAVLHDAAIPFTVVSAAGDHVAPPDVCRRMALLGGGSLVVDEAGYDHLWVITRPEAMRPILGAGAVAPARGATTRPLGGVPAPSTG